jgi:uncharacterized protein YggE
MRTNIYVVMSAVFLAIIIMGSVTLASMSLPLADKVQTTSPKTTGTTPMLGVDTTLISGLDPSIISSNDGNIVISENTNPRTMSLSGTGKISVMANQAIIILGVYTEGKTANTAMLENAELMSKVFNAIAAYHFETHTIGYTINPVYNYEMQMVVGYQVTNTLQITVTDLTKVGAIIDSASNAGANTINSVTFTIKDEDFAKYKLQAYTEAVKDVQAKAKAITEGFGITISGIQSINENYYYPVYRNVYTATDMKAGATQASTPIVSGTLDISVTLNVVYLLG